MIARPLCGCVALCALAFASLAEEPKDAKETKLKPVAVYSGSHSLIRRERFEVVTTEREWEKLWDQHRGKPKDRRFTEESTELVIDFDKHYVVAVFTGRCDGCVVAPRQSGDIVRIGYDGIVNQTEGGLAKQTNEEKAKEDALAPYAFVVLSKPVKTVIIEEDIRSRLDKPPTWKERKRFPAPKDNK